MPIVMVMGNHEFDHRTFPEELKLARAEAARFGVHLLENEAVVLAGVRFAGATLWTRPRASRALWLTCINSVEVNPHQAVIVREAEAVSWPTRKHLSSHPTTRPIRTVKSIQPLGPSSSSGLA
ncbi:hypothetical protein [Bradyrhizobium sp. SZCCHNS3052]|uniref:hypothetical protein n=1 Tax=Bradyrhizobium sp. SZCCHNS3052 TaxID=3057321 RepID=UPI002915F85D|nr:hypothetical protein [Bradyrhizobium sp. SZCCHNS3052]